MWNSYGTVVHQLKETLALHGKEEHLESFNAVLVYHVKWGRNAWHSTWNTTYVPGTLQPSWNAVCDLVHENRVQGSSCFLAVLPALHLQFDQSAFILTDSDLSAPFEQFTDASAFIRGISKKAFLAQLTEGPNSFLNKPRTVLQETLLTRDKFCLWIDRTQDPQEQRTCGKYKRIVMGSGYNWSFRPLDKPDFEIPVTAYEDLLERVAKQWLTVHAFPSQ